MNKGLKIIKLKVENKEKTLFDIDFININDRFNNDLFSTVLIGTNGSGKSYLMTLIIDIFRAVENELYDANDLKSNKNRKDNYLKYEYYNLTYSLNNCTYDIVIKNKVFTLKVNNKENELNNISIPPKILAVSFMVNDKFVFQPEEQSKSSYSYLGVRESSNLTFTSSIQKNICNLIIENLDNKTILNSIDDVLSFLNYDLDISIHFSGVIKSFFKRYSDKESQHLLKDSLIQKIDRHKERSNYRYNSLAKNISEVKIDSLVDFIINSKNKVSTGDGFAFKINLTGKFSGNNELAKNIEFLNVLIGLRLLKHPTLKLKKNGEFEFDNASSGEKHLLFSLIGLAAKLQENSLVFIDEPEISLHPNWQMQYVEYLKKIFVHIKGCHFIIATHSHFILSDLKGDSSSIVKIDYNQESKLRSAEVINFDTYAWSAENILYNVFKVRTTRNYYFEADLRELLDLIGSNSNDFKRLRKITEKLNSYSFNDSDPINIVLKEADSYLSKESELNDQKN